LNTIARTSAPASNDRRDERCDALWTNDNRLVQASQGLAINVLA
jgi:hypothetical protein